MLLGIIGATLLLALGLVYRFFNYRAESRVQIFIDEVRAGHYENAYALWDSTNGKYSMSDFLQDWGSDGDYTKGMSKATVVTSHGQGANVIVQVAIDKLKKPVVLRVNKETLKLSYAPGIR